jgi:hypothetical protein
MPKRFTESRKWEDAWFRKLNPAYKLLWVYILDRCDNAGLWEVDLELATFYTGFEYPKEEALKILDSRIFPINDKWFISKFITFQYNKLNYECYPHRPIIEILKGYGLIDENFNILINDENKGNFRVIKKRNRVQDKDKEKDIDKVLIKNGGIGGEHPLQEWISKNAPNVDRLKEPLTFEQCEKVLMGNSIEIVQKVLLSMHNFKDLLKKYISANLTLQNWLNRENNNGTNKQFSKKQPKGSITEDEYREQINSLYSEGGENTGFR